MKNQKAISKKVSATIAALLFTTAALATGGNGNEPPTSNERSGATFCDIYPWVCILATSGTGGNGNEPPEDDE